jgi:hypothetical protein
MPRDLKNPYRSPVSVELSPDPNSVRKRQRFAARALFCSVIVLASQIVLAAFAFRFGFDLMPISNAARVMVAVGTIGAALLGVGASLTALIFGSNQVRIAGAAVAVIYGAIIMRSLRF